MASGSTRLGGDSGRAGRASARAGEVTRWWAWLGCGAVVCQEMRRWGAPLPGGSVPAGQSLGRSGGSSHQGRCCHFGSYCCPVDHVGPFFLGPTGRRGMKGLCAVGRVNGALASLQQGAAVHWLCALGSAPPGLSGLAKEFQEWRFLEQRFDSAQRTALWAQWVCAALAFNVFAV